MSESKKEANQKKEIQRQIEKRLEDLHPKFLEAIRDAYPLAVLGSLCIATAAFTTQTYPNAQIYAISAASLFLIAFVISFAFKIFPNWIFAVLSYASTGTAILFLFFVVGEFAKTNVVLSSSVRLVGSIPNIVAFLMFTLFSYGLRKRMKSKAIRWWSSFAIPLGVFYVVYYLVVSIWYFAGFDISILSDALFYVANPIMAVLFTILVVIWYKQRKKKHESVSV